MIGCQLEKIVNGGEKQKARDDAEEFWERSWKRRRMRIRKWKQTKR